ncbi:MULTISPECIES: DUF3040 domain-containing protein [unclassified Paenarthrobacter]|uniref:DUF3040 domain-containing protein n=1 Tax=unclassified Paenarthrobacter TaxID=2634190 RepID=UPI003CF59CBD
MPLSEHERRVLQNVERELFIEDPALARRLESGRAEDGHVPRRTLGLVALAAGVLFFLLGLLENLAAVGWLGFLVAGLALVDLWTHRREGRGRRGR